MFELYYDNQCLISKNNVDEFMTILDYLFVERMCIGNVTVVFDNNIVTVNITELKDYFTIRNELVEYKIEKRKVK